MHRVYGKEYICVFGFMTIIADNRGDPKEKDEETHMIQIIRERIQKLAAQQDETPAVHFHQGPQGQPAPCFEERCPNPRLSV